MNQYFKGYSLAFYFLVTLVTFIISTALAGLSGVADNQGLAGGAIVLDYGLMADFGGLIVSIILLPKLKVSKIIRVNWIIASVIAILMTFLILRAKNIKQEVEPDSMPRMQTKPASEILFDAGFDSFAFGTQKARPNNLLFYSPLPSG